MRNKEMNRRSFLKAIGLAAGAATIVPASALGRGGFVAPSDRINMGFIGLGSMGWGNLHGFIGKSEVQVIAICDINREGNNYAGEGMKGREPALRVVREFYQRKNNVATWDGVKGYTDFREVLGNKDIDAVCLALPDHWHAYMAIAAAKAGKDMYSEKPLSRSIWEGRQMLAAVRKYKRVFQLGSQQRSGAEFRQTVNMVINGYIGDLQKVYAAVGGTSKTCTLGGEPEPDGFSMEMWLGNAPQAPYHHERVSGKYGTEGGTWRSWRDYSAGHISDWGAHNFDIGQWGLQKDLSGPVEIKLQDVAAGIEDLTFLYDNGIPMIRKRGPHQGMIQFIGSKGWVGVDRGKMYASDEKLLTQKLASGEKSVYVAPDDDHRQDFLDCIKTRKRPGADVEIGLSSANIYLTGEIALRLNRSLKWDARKMEFVGDAEANAMLRREMRGEFAVPEVV